MNKCLTIIVLLLLSSCCKEGIEVNKYVLTEDEKESITYLTNDIVRFSHSNGFEFDLTVTSRQVELRKNELQHCGDNFSSYEVLSVDLMSSIPELYINLEIAPEDFNPYMTISINKYYFDLNLSLEPDIDTLLINGNVYSNVYQADSFVSDSLLIVPKQILYNKNVGIIQIIMTNNEKYTIKE